MKNKNYKIEAITIENLDKVSMKCWDNREAQKNILEKQSALGLAVFDKKNICIGLVHFYKVEIPNWDDSFFPDYAKNRLEDWPLGWPLIAAKEKSLNFTGPVLGLSCFHVGLCQNSFEADKTYFNKGIGKSLLSASVEWAKENGCSDIIGIGGPNEVPEYNIQMGCLPWKSYKKLGFDTVAYEEDGRKKPWWVEKWGGKVKEQVDNVLSNGKELKEICARLMVMNIQKK